MIKDETLDYLLTLPGWCTDEKMGQLYNLVKRVAEENPDVAPLSVELGIFGGRSLFPLAYAHKEMGKGFALGIDSFDNHTPTEGSNAQANNDWWANLDIKGVFNTFIKATKRPDWDGYVKYLKGRSDSFAGEFKDESITLLHEDSNHNVETITRELELWSPKVKTGGYWVIDDCDWPECKEGYAKLPSFGFELVEDFTTWQIWRKVSQKVISVESGNINRIAFVGIPNPDGSIPTETATQDYIHRISSQDIFHHYEKTNLSLSDIKPLSIYLPDKYLPTDKWAKEYDEAKVYFAEQGIENIQWVAGIHAQAWGLTGRHPYLRNYPEAREYMGDAKLGCYLTHYILYCVMDAIDSEAFLVLETDCLFVEGWRDKAEQALKDVPADWDFLYFGSCCAMDKEPVHVKGNVWHFPHRPDKPAYYPQCGHAMLIRKKCVKYLIETQRDPCEPVDIALIYNAFPKLNVYAVLPRLATQRNLDNLAE